MNKKAVLIGVSVIGVLLLLTTVPVADGQAAAVSSANANKGCVQYLVENCGYDEGDLKNSFAEDAIIEAYENGYRLTAAEESSMRIKNDDYLYMMERLSEYNHAGERERTITIEGRCTWTETVEDELSVVEEESEDGESGEPTGPGIETQKRKEAEEAAKKEQQKEEEGSADGQSGPGVPHEEEPADTEPDTILHEDEPVTKEITVDNSMYEGLIHYDYRVFYYMCLLAACDRKTSDKILSTVTPLDIDFTAIDASEYENIDRKGARYYITREDIDRVFTYTTLDFQYYFDAVRDARDEYTYEECIDLPHIEDISGDPDTYEGEYTYYLPHSYLVAAESCYSSIENITGDDSDHIIGAKEIFNYASIQTYAASLSQMATETLMKDTLCQMYDGDRLYTSLVEKGTVNYTEEHMLEDGQVIVIDGSMNVGRPKSVKKAYSTIGEAAVAWCMERSCQGHTNGGQTVADAVNKNCWKYLQDKRDEQGYADCSSMCYRSYAAVGLKWPSGGYNTKDFYELFTSHPDMIIASSETGGWPNNLELMPGDLIFLSKDSSKVVYEKDNHIVMYAGNGMMVHASSGSRNHIHVQDFAGYKSVILGRGVWVIARPYLALPYEGNYDMSGGDRATGENKQGMAYALSEEQLIGITAACIARQGVGINSIKYEASVLMNLIDDGTIPMITNPYSAIVSSNYYDSNTKKILINAKSLNVQYTVGSASAIVKQEQLDAVKEVINEGNRCTSATARCHVSEIKSLTVDGRKITDSDRIRGRNASDFVSRHTIIETKDGTRFLFEIFPDGNGDAFGKRIDG